mmetsp:Transcript_30689/g.88591  ORF Transcript_30689/g.88591 Transcript_30689/m.88591 type:complete len:248 (-) Transcript_30689:96-839(-)
MPSAGPPVSHGDDALHVVWGRVESFGRRTAASQVEFLAMSSDSGQGGSQASQRFSSSGDTSRSAATIVGRRSGGPSPISGAQSLIARGSDELIADMLSVSNRETGGGCEASPETLKLAETVLCSGGLWSSGMPKHFSGGCVTCHWVHTARGCKRGDLCQFCHLPHTSPDLSRMGNNRKTHCIDFAEKLAETMHREGLSYERFTDVSMLVSSRSSFLRSLLLGDGTTPALRDRSPQAGASGAKRLLSL